MVHVVSNTKFAIKSQEAGVDAIVAEGFEAGGHNGREETTTMCLIPHVRSVVDLPLIAAGGIASGKTMAAAFALGAEGVQVGSRFAASEESSAHVEFKQRIIQATEGDTKLTLKMHAPVRLLNNEFYQQVAQLEANGASLEKFTDLLGKGRAKKGMFEGDLVEGELEIGQISAMIRQIQPAAEIIREMMDEFQQTIQQLSSLNK